MRDDIEEIKKRIDIVEFISSFIDLKKAGRNFKANCPFHQEKTPSFVISPERQIWHCFGSCGDGGDIIRFLMKWENITFFEALTELAEKAGVKLKNVDFEDREWKQKERLINLNFLAAQYFEHVLFKTNFGKNALEYLKNRGINPKVAQKFQLGYSPNSWSSLLGFLKKKKYSEQEVYDVGLAVSGRSGFYDRFRGRMMFPIKDPRGNVIGFSGRLLNDEQSEAKYINTPETAIYHKRESLFGVNLAKEAIKKEKNVILVEGEFDVISPYQEGIENIVAVKGSAVTKDHLMILKRYTDRLIFALDADTAGEEALRKAVDEAEDLDLEIEVANFDFAKDPDEAVREDPAAFKKALKKPVPVYDFIIDIAQRKYSGDDPFSKKKIGEETLPLIEKIKNPIVQSHYIKKLASLLDVTEKSIEIMIERLRRSRKSLRSFKPQQPVRADESREVNLQRYVLSLIFQNNDPYEFSEKILEVIEPSDFSIPAYSKIADKFIEFKKKNPTEYNQQKFIGSLDVELQKVFDELYLYASYETALKNEDVEKLIYEIKRISLKRQISQFLSDDKKEEEDELKNLSLRLKEVEKKIATI